MNIPGYDEWKLRSPEEDYERRGGKICPFCGAWSMGECEYDEHGEVCPWEESQPDPDDQRDQRIENEQMARDYPDDGDF